VRRATQACVARWARHADRISWANGEIIERRWRAIQQAIGIVTRFCALRLICRNDATDLSGSLMRLCPRTFHAMSRVVPKADLDYVAAQ
jgi:hypothetical protein